MKSNVSPPSEIEILFALNSAVANVPDPKALFQVIYETLRPVFHFEVATIILPTTDPEWAELFTLGTSLPQPLQNFEKPEIVQIKTVIDFDPSSKEIHQFRSEELNRSDFAQRRELDLIEQVLGACIYTLCPLPYGGSNIGHMMIGNRESRRIRSKDLPLLKKAMEVVASAVVATNSYAKLGERERDARSLLEFTTEVMDVFESKDIEVALAEALFLLHPFHYLYLQGLHSDSNESVCLVQDRRGWRRVPHGTVTDLESLIRDKSNERVQIRILEKAQFPAEFISDLEYHEVHGITQILLNRDSGAPCHLLLGHKEQQSKASSTTLFAQAAPQMYLAFRNLQSWEQVQALQDKLQLENRALLEEITPASSEKKMVGQSPAFRSVLNKARLVASTDTTVLILGETGTGKELLARFLHENSKRHGKPMVRVNCAALPTQLIESELFGHEKGSFTGAIEKRIGKFELAHGGTLFLDEIGELPLESQSKLLRVLQEQELERVGGHQVVPVDVRVVVATNRNLEQEIAKGSFRADLYFRINSFPIVLPPLRDRREDIGILAEMFLQRFSKQLGRYMRGLDREDISCLEGYRWPGNIRELEHIMENVAIISTEATPNLREFRKYLQQGPEVQDSVMIEPLDVSVSNLIRTALRATNGRIGGPKGAATLLGVNAKTLESKMRKLGIQRKVDFT